MTTRPYNELLELVQSLAGIQFSPIEIPRVKRFLNRRLRRAYDASDLWPRFFVFAEERQLVNGLIPYEEPGKRSVGRFLRVFDGSPVSGAMDFDFVLSPEGAFLVGNIVGQTSAWVSYKARQDKSYGEGVGDTQGIPAEWFDYAAHGAYSDWLRAEGQQEKSALADQEANELLADALSDPALTTMSNIVSTRIHTNSNRQLR